VGSTDAKHGIRAGSWRKGEDVSTAGQCCGFWGGGGRRTGRGALRGGCCVSLCQPVAVYSPLPMGFRCLQPDVHSCITISVRYSMGGRLTTDMMQMVTSAAQGLGYSPQPLESSATHFGFRNAFVRCTCTNTASACNSPHPAPPPPPPLQTAISTVYTSSTAYTQKISNAKGNRWKFRSFLFSHSPHKHSTVFPT